MQRKKSITEFKQVLESFAIYSDEAWLVFTSPKAVQMVFEQLGTSKIDFRALLRRRADVKFAVYGYLTERELRKHGIKADVAAGKYCAAEFGKKLAKEAKAGSQVLIARGMKGWDELLPPLAAARLWGEVF